MKVGDIALAPLPQANGQLKNRPVVLLHQLPPFGDFLVCGISTQLQQCVAGFDERILVNDPEFAATGLKAASLIRLGFLAVLPSSLSDLGVFDPKMPVLVYQNTLAENQNRSYAICERRVF